jgi:hypothetical protein
VEDLFQAQEALVRALAFQVYEKGRHASLPTQMMSAQEKLLAFFRRIKFGHRR